MQIFNNVFTKRLFYLVLNFFVELNKVIFRRCNIIQMHHILIIFFLPKPDL